MFNLGFWEMMVLGVMALVVVGPERLPGLARNIGKFLNDLKRTTNTITSEISAQIDEEKFSKSDVRTDQLAVEPTENINSKSENVTVESESIGAENDGV